MRRPFLSPSPTSSSQKLILPCRAAYADGEMVPVKSGSKDSTPVPCAGNDGTVLAVRDLPPLLALARERRAHTSPPPLQVEDLFYNTPQRLKALRSAADEYARILQVVIAYSIHNAGVALSCKKASAGSSNATADVNTTVGASTLDNIGATYGEQVKRELVEVLADSAEPRVKLKAWCSGTNYQGKKGRYLFFINSELLPSPLGPRSVPPTSRLTLGFPSSQTASSTARRSSAPSRPSTRTSSPRARTRSST